ncbi:MAG: class I SAM-dependent rRNA methyltransferase [Desulfuromonadaceae bacterium]|nr:class I SAM-dependent rRNA methyltransferase [Desulfuromonadaceae bacterium]MDD2853993.1 class I SAM-dependent rRNA methyltransferase [Desulfuromonadaceae bacterium]
MLELGHPWVVADGYTKKWRPGKAGEIVELCDSSGRFIASALLDPAERIIARVLDRNPMRLDSKWLIKRFQNAINLRKNHADLKNSNAYRLVNAEGDGLPGLTVDRYADYLMLQLYSSAWRPHLKTVTDILQELISPIGIYEKSRPQNTRGLEATSDSKKYGNLLAGRAAPNRLEVMENGLTFLVTLEHGLNTGLFLDQRNNRRDLMKRAAGKRVLNLFSYTGAFSVAAAAAGSEQVTSVDASASYSDWAKDNFAANRINHKQHNFIVGDCLTVLAKLKQDNKRFDIILMDPPSFSTTAKNRFTTRGGTSDLVASSLHLLHDGGLLITSSNHQKVDIADYLKELRRGALQSGCEQRVISQLGQPEDFPYPVTFPEGRYLKYVISVK